MIHQADTSEAPSSRPVSGLIDATGGLRHNPALDGLRGLAVVGVIAFHAGLVTGGYLGVDLFFVLSGFLITSLLLLEHRRRGTIDLAAFWIRRARRLLPAVIVVVAVASVVTLLFARAYERTDFGPDAMATLLYVANWRSIQGGGYWSQFAGSSLLDHTWSLAIEEQFYLVWPLVATVVLGRRQVAGDPDRRSRRLLVVAIIGAVASSALMIVQGHAGQLHDRLYLGTDTRAAGVLLGASLACVATRTTRPTVLAPGPRRAVEAAGWLGFAVLAVAWLFLDGRSSFLYQGGLLVCGVAATAVIACVTTVDDGRLARYLSWRPFVALGLVSYGLYLWHWPIFVWVDEERVGISGPALLALRLALTGVMALLSYRFVEMPVRRGAFAARPALAAGVAMVAVLALVSVAGKPPAPPIDAAQAAAAITPLGPLTESAGGVGAAPRVLILGDSVGEAVATGVVPFQERFGIEARSLAVTGCGIARENPIARYEAGVEVDESACSWVLPAWRTEIETWRPDAVLLILGWPGQTERFVDGDWRRPCDPTFDQWYAGEVDAALELAGAAGSHVAISTVPYYRPTDASETSDAATSCLNRIYRGAAERRGAEVVDLAEHVCPSGRCAMERDGVELRPDGLHFAEASSVWAADWLLHDQWRALGAPATAPPA